MKRLEKYKSIRSALKAFLDGTTVYAIPCKLNPYYMDGVFLSELNRDFLLDNKWDTTPEKCFYSAVNELLFYGTSNESGMYLSFYYEV